MRAPTIYYHFENLHAIVEALLQYVVTESAAFATSEAERDGPCAERLASLLSQHVERLTEGPYDLYFVVNQAQADAFDFPEIATSVRRWRTAVRSLIEQGVAAGEFRRVDPRLRLAMIRGMVLAALQVRHHDGTVDAAAVAEFAVRSLGGVPGRRA